jgi:hypothetical protein
MLLKACASARLSSLNDEARMSNNCDIRRVREAVVNRRAGRDV